MIDFVQPGLLGKHAVFNEQLALPIQLGSQAKASHLQIATALRCAEEVRTLIKPILLRRLKSQGNRFIDSFNVSAVENGGKVHYTYIFDKNPGTL